MRFGLALGEVEDGGHFINTLLYYVTFFRQSFSASRCCCCCARVLEVMRKTLNKVLQCCFTFELLVGLRCALHSLHFCRPLGPRGRCRPLHKYSFTSCHLPACHFLLHTLGPELGVSPFISTRLHHLLHYITFLPVAFSFTSWTELGISPFTSTLLHHITFLPVALSFTF